MKMRFLLLLFGFLVACSTPGLKDQNGLSMAPGAPEMADLQNNTKASDNNKDLNDNETDMRNLPQDLNARVTTWMEYFQGKGRPHMQKYLARSSKYLPRMREILKSHGLPEDLVYIALIESGFSHKALSRASAVGYWQFIRGTGRRYGLLQNYYIDERRDFEESTEAAALYLKGLYNLFGSWYLAIASYNVGENRIKRLVMQHYTRDFWELAEKNHLPRETTNYVPKFLAARLIAKHPRKYGFENVDWEAPLDYKEIPLNNKGVDLKKMAANLGIPTQELYDLNPSYKRGIIPARKTDYKLRVPSTIVDEKIDKSLQASLSKISVNVADAGGETYRIRRGDTLGHIARRHRTSVQALREANNLTRRAVLYPGKKIIIPPSNYRASAKTPEPAKAEPIGNGERQYVVQEGDNLYTIAKRFGVSLSDIKKRNQLGRRSLLNIGKVLVIPAPAGSRDDQSSMIDKVAQQIVHVVRAGDNLYGIARRYNTTIKALTEANNLSRRARLNVGRELLIP